MLDLPSNTITMFNQPTLPLVFGLNLNQYYARSFMPGTVFLHSHLTCFIVIICISPLKALNTNKVYTVFAVSPIPIPSIIMAYFIGFRLTTV